MARIAASFFLSNLDRAQLQNSSTRSHRTNTEGAPGSLFEPGSWGRRFLLLNNVHADQPRVANRLSGGEALAAAPFASFAKGGSALLFFCHPACPACPELRGERSRRDRSGPIFPSAPPFGVSTSPVIPSALLAPSFEGSEAEGTGATAPSAVAEWRDRGSILPRTDDKWAGGASAPFASAVFWTPRLLQRVAPASSLFLFSHASLLRKLKTYD